MKKFILTLMAAAMMPVLAMAQGCPTPATATATVTLKRKIPGLLENGEFTVANINGKDKKVHFAGGNLQYTKSTKKWKIMDHQYDMEETTGMTIGDNYASQDVVTLFGWGTSGWDNTAADATSVHYQPYSTCNTNHSTAGNSYQYGPSNSKVVGSNYLSDAQSWSKSDSYKNYDWGVFNSGDLGSGWRTLTAVEWGYLLNTRTNAESLRKWATVNGVGGLIIMPDGWSGEIADSYNLGEWTTLEGQGAVFLPAAGGRNGTGVFLVGSNCYYWSSTAESNTGAYYLHFNSGNVDSPLKCDRYYGWSVRLVQDVE